MKTNAYNVSMTDANLGRTRRLTIPMEAIKDVGFNILNTIYVQKIAQNHIGLTQDGSVNNLIGKINGFFVTNGYKNYKQYQIGCEKGFEKMIDHVIIVPDKKRRYIDIYGYSC